MIAIKINNTSRVETKIQIDNFTISIKDGNIKLSDDRGNEVRLPRQKMDDLIEALQVATKINTDKIAIYNEK